MRRGMFTVTVAAFAGCAFTIAPGEPGDDGFAGGDDVDAAIARDGDGDGVLDDVDVCPSVFDPDQRDHDADARGDACDPCPHRPDDGSDQDGDGIGDSCDPRPGLAGDRLAYFEGFYAPVAWTPVIGTNTWTFDPGTVRQPSTADAYQLIRDDDPDLGHVQVEARFRVEQITGDTSGRRSTGIVAGYVDNDTYWFCGVAATEAGGAEVNTGKVRWGLFGNSYDHNIGGFPTQLPGEWTVLRARTSRSGSATTIDCAVERGGVQGSASYTTGAGASGDLGLRTNGAAASFDYVFVVATP